MTSPMYIAEMAPPQLRGRMVSLAQLNIVIGISAAFFSNYLVLTLGQSDLAWAESLRLGEWNWRWMLGVEALPAVFCCYNIIIIIFQIIGKTLTDMFFIINYKNYCSISFNNNSIIK